MAQRIRIVAPPARVREVATMEDVREGDTIEQVEPPVFQMDPVTRKPTTRLQQFVVTRRWPED